MADYVEKINPVFAHNSGDGTRSFCVYTVYDNRTDFPVIVDGEARECAKAMGLSLASFYSAVVRAKSGAIKRWNIQKRYIDGRKEYTGWDVQRDSCTNNLGVGYLVKESYF